MHSIECIRSFLKGDAPDEIKVWVERGILTIYEAATATTSLLNAARRRHIVRRKGTTK
jgi:hypothetical protein